ncbi:MAG: hypothetical protein M3P27_08890 [Acidobacteriota bacterium]|nr:hypothetical protein [Acidobacteriota bacterium]
MDTSTMQRLARVGPICLLMLAAAVAAAQEVPPMVVQPNVLPAKGGKHKVLVTLGNRTPTGMDTVKLTVESNGASAKFGEVATINPYQWQTIEGTVADDDGQVLVVEYILNDKPQKLAVMLNEPQPPTTSGGGNMPAQRGMPPALWLGAAALLGAMVTLAGAAAGRRGSSR